jgi:hypothetical protein
VSDVTPRFVRVDDHRTAADFVLRRAQKAGSFHLVEPFTYLDPDGTAYDVAASDEWSTDFASTPVFALWLVPSDGIHAPAAVLHDALGQRRTVPRLDDDVRADAIFRDAMAHLGVPLLRRWMMWAAVALRTLWFRRDGAVLARTRIAVIGVVLALTGIVASLDVVDAGPLRLPGREQPLAIEVPWMGGGSLVEEVLLGAVVALLAILVVTVVFADRWPLGLVASLAVVPFAFPMAVAALAYGCYFVVELALSALLRRRQRAGAAGDASPPGVPHTLRD